MKSSKEGVVMPLYIVAVGLVVFLVAVSCVALALGLLGELGVVRLLRCPACAHFVVGSWNTPLTSCPYCRHEHLAHPLRTLRHPFQELVHH
jgi:hypothetical protein